MNGAQEARIKPYKAKDFHHYRFNDIEAFQKDWPMIQDRLVILGHYDVPIHIELGGKTACLDDMHFDLPVTLNAHVQDYLSVQNTRGIVSLETKAKNVVLNGSAIDHIKTTQPGYLWIENMAPVESLDVQSTSIIANGTSFKAFQSGFFYSFCTTNSPGLPGRVTDTHIFSKDYIGEKGSLAVYNRQLKEFASYGPMGGIVAYCFGAQTRPEEYREGYMRFAEEVAQIEKGNLPTGYYRSTDKGPLLPSPSLS